MLCTFTTKLVCCGTSPKYQGMLYAPSQDPLRVCTLSGPSQGMHPLRTLSGYAPSQDPLRVCTLSGPSPGYAPSQDPLSGYASSQDPLRVCTLSGPSQGMHPLRTIINTLFPKITFWWRDRKKHETVINSVCFRLVMKYAVWFNCFAS